MGSLNVQQIAVKNNINSNNVSVIEKYINKLCHLDIFMEILLIYVLFSCMSLPKFINELLKYPATK